MSLLCIVFILICWDQAMPWILPNFCFRTSRYSCSMKANNDPSIDSNEYSEDTPQTGFDMFGEPTVEDEEMLRKLRRQKRLDNDRWQSRLFQREHGGLWSGIYDVYKPLMVSSSGSNSEPSLARVQSGFVTTVTSASKYNPESGVDISIAEDYSITFDAEAKKDNEDSYRNFLSDAEMQVLLIPSNTKVEYQSCDFRTMRGNQAVGNAYTLCRLVPPIPAPTTEELLGDTVLDSTTEPVAHAYVGELGIKEDGFRTRVRYVYRYKDSSTRVLRPEEEDLYAYSLYGITVLREKFIEPVSETIDNTAGQPSRGFLPTGRLDYDANTLGMGIYDPQESGEPYVELALPGRLTLFFPRGLRRTYDNGKYGVMTMEWLGKNMRYQVDRKFGTVDNGAINTLELTEIRIDDSVAEYPDPLFNPSPKLLK